jgi:hypothetical protein
MIEDIGEPSVLPSLPRINADHPDSQAHHAALGQLYATSTRQLFGGAVEMAVPSRMADISEFRDIPDSQEVSLTVYMFRIRCLTHAPTSPGLQRRK